MKKTLITIVLTVLACLCVVGTTLAFLVDKTDSIVNTFTVGNVDIELTETANLDLKLVPGKELTKDPKVTVKANSETCWLFVKVEKSNNIDTYLDVVMAEGWTPLGGTTEVYYREVTSSATDDQSFAVLKGNKVTVKNSVTKAQLDSIKTQGPTLTFTAYAVQKDGLTVEQAWEQANLASNYPADTTTT